MFDPENPPDWMDADDWTDFQEHRKEIKKPMTYTAKRRMLKKLYEMRQAGEPIDQCMERSMVNGWQDVFPMPPELKRSKPQAHQDYKPEPKPEKTCSDEQAKDNIRQLHEQIGKSMKISGGRQ